MFSTYKQEDVIILLKDISNLVEPQAAEIREKLIQSGVHYSSMLPLEYEPSAEYLTCYTNALAKHAKETAQAIARVGDKIWQQKGEHAVLVSLARAGTPIGILLKHYLEQKYAVKIDHYTISIIRDLGIDKNAINFILAQHLPAHLVFVDGWTGKGTIRQQLDLSMREFHLQPELAVLSDPARLANLWGTTTDFLIPSACLNATVAGLLSRTFYRSDIIKASDFHGSIFYKNLIKVDQTYNFIHAVEQFFDFNDVAEDSQEEAKDVDPATEIAKLAKEFNITDRNFIKPSIGEATRVLLRRIPWKILVHSCTDEANLQHIYTLAQEKHVEVSVYPLQNYKACGLIKRV